MKTRLARQIGFLIAVWCLALAVTVRLFAVEANDSSKSPVANLSTDAKHAAGQKMTAVELARQIDVLVSRGSQAKKIPVSPPADDAEFLRRVYLDIAGTIPPLERVETFLNDTQSDKRAGN